ncbi:MULTISPECIES: M2 family metallopeptidase [unclassified Duganella]|uniref:M2 family metallopeptidase n=1 Tax=unclassified Duganella TaxID=2636909 RepID=UPI0008890780|nr:MULTISPECIES: M2 family metallopeptidase [unclassified Duganella]SDF96840.1 peptidyl-dipeptidase A [Duganella sp. OV458]SDJ07908.1 peptidyl-dipeptidase A [Duganella sp. OV510]
MSVTPKIISTLLATALAAASATALAAPTAKPTAAEAERFLADTEAKLNKLNNEQARAAWVGSNFITDDTEAIASYFAERYLSASGEAAIGARRFNGLKLSTASARKLMLLQQTVVFADPKEREQFATLQAALNGAYGKAKYCPQTGDCMALGEMEKVLATSRDEAKLKEMWLGWHAQAQDYKQKYADYIALSNKGAQQMGFADTGALWRSQYDMPPEAFSAEMERLWQQVKPLYDSLHTYTRYKLRATYGADVVPLTGPIPSHLFGNMWSQSWNNLYPILKPANSTSSYDLGKVLEQRKTDAKQMTKYAEGFYTSLGMQKLPATFWERSLLTKPRDRDVVCHASAWPMNEKDDVRIKMCITPTAEDFTTIHHELGHVYYFLGYTRQPFLFRNGANDGFHEAIGDTVALSITPAYLKQVGLMDQEPDVNADIPQLLERALSKVAILPFAYTMDKWRWDVYAGKTKPADYDKRWWQLREEYMGMKRPAPGDDAKGFDAGAKYHVAADVSYARYFLADMLQFQFHRALCREAGYSGPLNRCSVYGNAKAGAKLQQLLELGASKPWPEALKAISGEDKIDGNALLEYFAPLKTWLDQQNAAFAAAEKK